VALILPTSLCATQIARLAADRLNAAAKPGAPRTVAFLHTEGCGFGGETMYQLLQRTYRGYVTHPNVAAALLLEHGCEKVPNDIMRRQLEQAGIPLDRYGWADVQLDGGIDRAIERIAQWFASAPGLNAPLAPVNAGLNALALGLVTEGDISAATAESFAWVARRILHAGGSVLLPEGDPLLAHAGFAERVLGATAPRATLAYGQPLGRPGLHVVATETDHWVENVTGLAGCGAQAVLGLAGLSGSTRAPVGASDAICRGTPPRGRRRRAQRARACGCNHDAGAGSGRAGRSGHCGGRPGRGRLSADARPAGRFDLSDVLQDRVRPGTRPYRS
jgi:altronate dehydratase